MKIKTKKLLLTITVCLFSVVAIMMLSIVFSAGAESTAPVWQEISVVGNYVIDETFTMPSRYVMVEGKQYDSEVKLRCPDGVTLLKTEEFSDVVFEQAGKYFLTFEARDDGGNHYKDEIEILVADKLWRVTDAKSSVVYGHHDLAKAETEGLLVRLAQGDTLTFNKIIDLSAVTADDVLFSGFITPDTRGVLDFERLFFTFTDVYDPDCTLTVSGRRSLSSSNWEPMSYWTAGGSGQYLAGIEGTGTLHQNNQWGRPYMHSFVAQTITNWSTGTKADAYADDRQFKIYFDPNTMQVLDAQKTMIIDLDDPLYHTTDPLWKGFTSGKVICSVTAQDYIGETANFCITELFGYDLTDENVFIETDAPDITVDIRPDYVDSLNNFIPKAVVGYKYPVPTASAYDAYSGEREVKAAVYYNYSDPDNMTTCSISDGRFDVAKEGRYAIVYTAYDAMGNQAKKVYWITAVSALESNLSITLDMTDIRTSAYCGEKVGVAAAAAIGGSGDAEIVITASLGNVVLEITNGIFLPELAGAWTITYTATDYAGVSADKTYTVQVEAGEEPIFVDEPVLPRFLLSGVTYSVPEVYANDYSSGACVKRAAEMVMVDIGGSSRSYKIGETFMPIADAKTEYITLIFTVDGVSLEKQIPAVMAYDDEELLIENLFVGEGFDWAKSDGGLTMTAKSAGDFSWIFANAVAAENASVTVGGIAGSSDFDALKVVFTDYADADISVTVYVENTSDGYLRILFGDTDRELSKGFALSNNEFVFSYSSGKFFVDNIGVAVLSDDNGKPFIGFPSGRVYIAAEAVNAAAGSGYVVKKIDNMSITNLPFDRIKPRIAIDGVYGGIYAKDSEYVIPSALASDTIDPNVSFTMTVKSPSGEVICDTQGKLLSAVDPTVEYRILLSEFGQYKVEYTATDFNGNKATMTYGINVLDRTAPVVTIEDSWNATASVGEQVTLPAVTVSDDKSSVGNITVYRTVRNPNGVLIVFGFDYTRDEAGQLNYTEYKFTFNYTGVYRFIVLAMDEAGNQTIVQYFVTVS